MFPDSPRLRARPPSQGIGAHGAEELNWPPGLFPAADEAAVPGRVLRVTTGKGGRKHRGTRRVPDVRASRPLWLFPSPPLPTIFDGPLGRP